MRWEQQYSAEATHSTPYTLRPTLYTRHPMPCALRPTPCALRPTPYALHPAPYSLPHPPYTLRPTPYALHSNTHTPKTSNPIPYNSLRLPLLPLHPTPKAPHPALPYREVKGGAVLPRAVQRQAVAPHCAARPPQHPPRVLPPGTLLYLCVQGAGCRGQRSGRRV